jgi:hypothetical protein
MISATSAAKNPFAATMFDTRQSTNRPSNVQYAHQALKAPNQHMINIVESLDAIR